MKTFIHVGFPKCLSTSLQRSVFVRNSEVFYLGIGSDGAIGYRDDCVAAVFEFYLKYARAAPFRDRSAELHSHLGRLKEQARNQGARVFGASSEHIAMAFTADCIDIEDRVRRLAELFGGDCQILLLVRNQASLIRSIYGEAIRGGYAGSFDDFVEYLSRFQEKNFISELAYSYSIRLFSGTFGLKNVSVLPYESVVRDGALVSNSDGQPVVLEWLGKQLGLKSPLGDIAHSNAALTREQIAAKRVMNSEHRHDLGQSPWVGNENHRLGGYWRYSMDLELPPGELFRNVVTKRRLIECSASVVGADCGALEIQRTHGEWRALLDRFESDNRAIDGVELAEKLVLPSCYFQMS